MMFGNTEFDLRNDYYDSLESVSLFFSSENDIECRVLDQ